MVSFEFCRHSLKSAAKFKMTNFAIFCPIFRSVFVDVLLFFVQSRVRILRPIWLGPWKRAPNSPCLCLPRLTILYLLMCIRWGQLPLLHGSFRVNLVKNSTTRGRRRLTAEPDQTRRSPLTIREKCITRFIFTVIFWFLDFGAKFLFLKAAAIFGAQSLIFKIWISVGPSKSGGSSDTSPPLQSFAEESSPENLMPSRMVNGQSTESLDSLSDESGGVHHPHRSHNRSSSGAELRNLRNPVPPPRKVNKEFLARNFSFLKATFLSIFGA